MQILKKGKGLYNIWDIIWQRREKFKKTGKKKKNFKMEK